MRDGKNSETIDKKRMAPANEETKGEGREKENEKGKDPHGALPPGRRVWFIHFFIRCKE